jgi:phage terminase large subunit-like protein
MAWDLSCLDWEDRIREGRSLIPDLPLDRELADKAVSIFNELRLPDVAGMPMLKDAGGDWQREIVAALHGSLDRTTGKRRIQEIFNLVPKKNNKTTGGAAIMLTSLLMNKRPNAEFLLVAPTKEIALIAFKQIEGMIKAEEWLVDILHRQFSLKKITDRRNGATLQIKSFDTSVLTGVKPSGVLIDELHVIAENSDADRVIGQLRGGLISQEEGFLIFITTQSEREPHGVFLTELTAARSVRDGTSKHPMLPVLYEFPRDIAADPTKWQDPTNWWMVTPNRDRSITIERLKADFEKAKEAGEAEIRRWATQHLNIQIGLGLRASHWVGAEYWEQNEAPLLTLDDIIQQCEVVVAGVDGGGLEDLLSLGILGRHSETKDWLLWTHSWAYTSVLDRHKMEAQRFRDFEKAGELTIVKVPGQEIRELAEMIEKVSNAGLLASVGLDPMGIGAIVDELANRGIKDDRVVGVPQGYRLSPAIWTAEISLANGKLTPANQAILRWAVGNARVESKGSAVSITKQVAGRAKIDPLIASFNAIQRMSLNPEARGSYLQSATEMLVLG